MDRSVLFRQVEISPSNRFPPETSPPIPKKFLHVNFTPRNIFPGKLPPKKIPTGKIPPPLGKFSLENSPLGKFLPGKFPTCVKFFVVLYMNKEFKYKKMYFLFYVARLKTTERKGLYRSENPKRLG